MIGAANGSVYGDIIREHNEYTEYSEYTAIVLHSLRYNLLGLVKAVFREHREGITIFFSLT